MRTKLKELTLEACKKASKHNKNFTIDMVEAEIGLNLYGVADGSISARIRELKKEGQLIRIKPGIYTLR